MPSPRITPKQREVLDHLSKHAAFSREKARAVPGFDEVPAEKLTQRGVLNKRYVSTYGAAYWIRGQDEETTGTSVPAGFIVVLHRDLTTPSGKTENLFLARAPYRQDRPLARGLGPRHAAFRSGIRASQTRARGPADSGVARATPSDRGGSGACTTRR